MDVVRAAARHLGRAAVAGNDTATYSDLLLRSANLVKTVMPNLKSISGLHANRRTVAVMAPPGHHYVEATWSTWLSGCIAVPLCLTHPVSELEYVLENAQVQSLLTTRQYASKLEAPARHMNIDMHFLEDNLSSSQADQSSTTQLFNDLSASSGSQSDAEQALHGHMQNIDHNLDDGALLVYTSGTTGKPKGALHTHRSLRTQIQGLSESWAWQKEDRILHALPLHHVHGIINALYCAHYSGACVEFLPKFSPSVVWDKLKRQEDKVTVYMGVPTMYSYLLSQYDAAPKAEQQQARQAAKELRLTVSGSAACPLPVMSRWENLSGDKLLERYGMTETGMVVSNPYQGERRPGTVGLPLPGVTVKVAAVPEDAEESQQDGANFHEGPGELLVKGENLFKEYWNRPDATAEAFDADGWFKTGDTAASEGSPPYWRILGRTSVDIIKSGGYKISALEIENALLAHPAVNECAVVGVEDETQGQVVAAILTCHQGQEINLEILQKHAAEKLAPYQIPKLLKMLDEMPRNAMGKINKKALVKDVFPQQA